MGSVTVEQVAGRAAFKRFVELPYFIHHGEPRWCPPLAAYERWRLDPHRNPFFEHGDAVYLLARVRGRPAGRMTAHVAAADDRAGWFGFYDVIDDAAVVGALVDAARRWLRERGCRSMTGPASFAVDDEAGVLVSGFDVAGATGRPWHPPWYAAHLRTAGLADAGTGARLTWRLPARPPAGDSPAPYAGSPRTPRIAGRYGDPRLVISADAGSIVAVPDLAEAAGSVRALARRGRQRTWTACTVLCCDGDPVRLVPLLQRVAGAAGYRWVIAPWSPDPSAPPETVHHLFTTPLD